MKKLIIMALLLMPVSLFAQKFGHFNSATIIQAMPEYTKGQQEIETMRKQFEDDLKRQQDEFNKKTQEYQAQHDSLPTNIQQRREQELSDMYQRIQQNYQDNQSALQKASSEKMQAITTKVLDAVKAIGESDGYVYIMDVTGGIPYISTTLSTDVTAKIKTKLGIK